MVHHLDARYLLCPLPVIRVQDLASTLSPGDTIEVTATDPGVLHDIPAWCRMNGHLVRTTQRRGDDIVVVLDLGKGDLS